MNRDAPLLDPVPEPGQNVAGRTVSDPTTAKATTRIVPVANDWKVDAPARYMPAIAIIT